MQGGYKSVPQTTKKEEDKRDGFCLRFFCWVFQIFVWGLIAATVTCWILFNVENDSVEYCGFGLGFCYLVYMILEFCSPTARYLCHKTTGNGMYQKMGVLFRTHPDISFHCECYHYETRHYTERDSNGNTHTRTETVRVTTYTESFSIPYYSSRDVSGLFYLNCDKAFIRKKAFIKLKLKEEINFADAISYMDYEYYKSAFWRRNRFRDVYMDFHETRTIPGLLHHNLVNIGNENPCSVNFFFYFVSVLLTLCQFYKSYVDSFCVTQGFKVRKLVSTRYDLNQPVYVQKYTPLIPQINLIKEQYNYEPSDYNYLNQDIQVNLPTAEELEKAEQYKSKVPDYTLSSGGGNIQAGVIEDNPSYSSFDNDLPPAEFASVAGNVALNANQVNAAGNAPAEFDKPGFEFNIAPSAPGGYSSSDHGQGYNPPANPPA